jgi:hypothetical protein
LAASRQVAWPRVGGQLSVVSCQNAPNHHRPAKRPEPKADS